MLNQALTLAILISLLVGNLRAETREVWEPESNQRVVISGDFREESQEILLTLETLLLTRFAGRDFELTVNPLCPDLEQKAKKTRKWWLTSSPQASTEIFADVQYPLPKLAFWLSEFAKTSRISDLNLEITQNGLNPNDIQQLIESLGWSHEASQLKVFLENGTYLIQSRGGSILDWRSERADRLSFIWLAEGLPWKGVPTALPDGDREAFGRELLKVESLPAGCYELRIDDRLIAQFSDMEFREGIAIDSLQTPQTIQAADVVQKTRKRFHDFILPRLRMAEQIHAFERKMSVTAESAGNFNLAVFQMELDRMRQEQQRLITAADEAWHELRELAQPMPRRFEIRPAPLVHVHGRVLIGGMPISGAAIELHGQRGVTAVGTTDAMGFFELRSQLPAGIPAGEGWLVVLAKIVLPNFMSLEKNGHRVILRTGVNEIELHYEKTRDGE